MAIYDCSAFKFPEDSEIQISKSPIEEQKSNALSALLVKRSDSPYNFSGS